MSNTFGFSLATETAAETHSARVTSANVNFLTRLISFFMMTCVVLCSEIIKRLFLCLPTTTYDPASSGDNPSGLSSTIV